MKKLLLIAVGILSLFSYSQAQSGRRVVAIMPFVSKLPANSIVRVSQVQEKVIEILNAKSNITFVDRSKDTLVVNELYNQTRLESVNADALVGQGKLLGANDIIAGTLTNATVEMKKVNSKIPLVGTTEKIKYSATIGFSIQIVDVETGQFKDQKVITVNTADEDKIGSIFGDKGGGLLMADTKDQAIVNALNKSKQVILKWINQVYPPDIKILKVEEKTKGGYPETILVTGLDESVKKGTVIFVSEVEMLDAGGGKMLRRTKKLAELKVQTNEGEITICKVTDGEKELGAKIDAGAKFAFELKK